MSEPISEPKRMLALIYLVPPGAFFCHLSSSPRETRKHLITQQLNYAQFYSRPRSAYFFDVAGAKAFGFRSYWVNRSATPADELGVTPDATLKSLTGLVDFLTM